LGDQAITRFNDDGEPSGTAGSPIFQVLKGYDLYNVIVVVIRYFGGTKLGTGGLIKTYGGVASRAIKDAVIKKQYITKTIKLKYPYELSGIVSGILDQFNAEIVDSSYTIDIQQIIQIRIDFESKFCDYLKNQTSGKIFIDKR
jgi:putative IMPACT (imprinted ancient) family translation regulator